MTKIRECILDIKPYVPGKPIEEVQRELGIDDVVKMASNENPLGPSKEAIKVIKEIAAKVHIYPDGNNFQLKKKLAEILGVKESNLIIGNGSDEIIKILGEVYLNPQDEVVVADPTFSEYEFVTKLMGGKLIRVPVREDMSHDLEAMAQAITKKTKLVFICNPNNPTGNIVTKKEFEEFLTQVPKDVLVILDEAYAEYVEDRSYPDSIGYIKAGHKNVVALRTFSKIYGLAGLRVGYGVMDEEVNKLLHRVREPFNVNLIAQQAALASLDNNDHVKASVQLNEAGKKQLYTAFEEMDLKYIPTETNFIFADIGLDSRQVFEKMLRKGIIIRTGDVFGCPTYIRVTVDSQDNNARFIAALKETIQEMK